MMPLATTLLQDLQDVPLKIWLHLGLGILVIGIVLIILMRMSRIVITIIALMIVVIVGYQWFVLRNEPAFITPVIEAITPYSPFSFPEKKKDFDKKDPILFPVQEKNTFNVEDTSRFQSQEPAPMVEFPAWEPYPSGARPAASPADGAGR